MSELQSCSSLFLFKEESNDRRDAYAPQSMKRSLTVLNDRVSQACITIMQEKEGFVLRKEN